MNKRTLFIVGGAVAVLMLCACVAVAGFFFYTAGQTADVVKTELAKTATAVAALPTEAAPVDNPAPTVVAPQATGPVNADEAANIFLRYLGNQQYGEAVAVSSSELRKDSNTAELLCEIVEDKGLQPESWKWTKNDLNAEKQETYLTGEMTFANGRQGSVEVQLASEDGQWKVFYMDLKTNDGAEDLSLNASDLAKVSADVFVQFWKDGEYDLAFAMGSKAFVEQVGTPDKLKEILGGTGLQLQSWTWEDVSTFQMEGTGQQVIEWKGTGKFQDALQGPLTVQLVEENGNWMILYFDVKTQ